MARKGLKFNLPGFEALREDAKVQADVVKRARAIADASGGEEKGYIVRDNLAREGRSGATVMATGHAARSNAKHQTLVRNLSKGK